jgi:hypothetical protein
MVGGKKRAEAVGELSSAARRFRLQGLWDAEGDSIC